MSNNRTRTNTESLPQGFHPKAWHVCLCTIITRMWYGRPSASWFRQLHTCELTVQISPLVNEGVDPAAAIGMPSTTQAGGVDPASLYPNIDPSKHVVMEVIEPHYLALHAETAKQLKPWLRTRQAALEAELAARKQSVGVATVLSESEALLLGSNASAAAAASVIQPPRDVQALAQAMATSAGATASQSPADYLAAATILMPSFTSPTSAVPLTDGPAGATTDPAIPSTGASSVTAPTTTTKTTSATDSEPQGGGRRRLQQANTVQDLLVVYTPAGAAAAGGEAAIQNTIRTAVAETNKAYADSGVPVTLNLVGARLVSLFHDTTRRRLAI